MILNIWVNSFFKNVLDLIKQKDFILMIIWLILKYKDELLTKEKFDSLLTDRKIRDKNYEHVLNVWNKFEMRTMKDYRELYLKYDVLSLANMFDSIRNNN